MHIPAHDKSAQYEQDERHDFGNSTLKERIAPESSARAGISKAPLKRRRSTPATQRRIENTHKLIGELSTHDMLADEIGRFLKFSPSGTRKYIQDLREAGVIKLSRYIDGTANYLGKAVYQISPDPERVKTFLAALTQHQRKATVAHKEGARLREQRMGDTNRYFHIMADDAQFVVRINRSPVARDPLVAALFGVASSANKNHA